MDGLAKFVGYVVLVLFAIGAYSAWQDKREAKSGTIEQPVIDAEEERLAKLENERERLRNQLQLITAERKAFVKRNAKAVQAITAADQSLTDYANSEGWLELFGRAILQVDAEDFCTARSTDCDTARSVLGQHSRLIEDLRLKILNVSQQVGYELVLQNDCQVPVTTSVQWTSTSGPGQLHQIEVPPRTSHWRFGGKKQRVVAPTAIAYATAVDKVSGHRFEWKGDKSLQIGNDSLSASVMNLEPDSEQFQYRLLFRCEVSAALRSSNDERGGWQFASTAGHKIEQGTTRRLR